MRLFPLILALGAASTPVAAAEKRFPVSGFDAILLSGSMDVSVTTGRDPSVVAEGSEAMLERLDIRTEGNTLVIAYRRDMRGSWSDSAPKVRVMVPQLSGATISGSGDMVIDRVDAPNFAGRISGSGDLRVGSLASGAVEFRISGSGDLVASGRCTDLTARISGSGDMRLDGLTCQRVDLAINGSGNIAVAATQSGKLATNGSGDIRVTGGATCTVRKSGSGTIVCG